MDTHYDKMTILRIAKYYYLDGMNQQEISALENIHRSQISRILKMARELGYVKIRVSTPESFTADYLGKQLQELLKMKEVAVSPRLSTTQDQAEALYFFAARKLEAILPQCSNIGIGLGKTLYHVASQLTTQVSERKINFFSIVGFSGSNNPYLQGSVILDHFVRKFNGSPHYNNLPICTSMQLLSPIDLKRHEALKQAYRSIDTIVLSVGGQLNIDYPYFEEFSLFSKDINISQGLTKSHANLLGHIVYEDGTSLKLPEDYCITSMALSSLCDVSNVICIAFGEQKIDPIINIAKQGYITTLITDESTAQKMLMKLKN
jgi:DNA-binding transcriptional regulator LsrR (DeoR family)